MLNFTFIIKINTFFFYKVLLDGTYPHTHSAPTLFFPFLPHWLTMGRKHIQKQNEIINELYLSCFLNLLRKFLSTYNIFNILPSGFNREKKKKPRRLQKSINIKKSISNFFFFKLKKFMGRWSTFKLQEGREACEREIIHFSIGGVGSTNLLSFSSIFELPTSSYCKQ